MKIKPTGRATSMLSGICVGSVISLLATLICTAVITTLVLDGQMRPSTIGYCGYLVIPLSVSSGCIVAMGMVKRRKMLTNTLVAAVYCLVSWSVVGLWFGGVRHGALIVGLIAFGTAFLISVTGLRGGGRGRFDGRKYRPR